MYTTRRWRGYFQILPRAPPLFNPVDASPHGFRRVVVTGGSVAGGIKPTYCQLTRMARHQKSADGTKRNPVKDEGLTVGAPQVNQSKGSIKRRNSAKNVDTFSFRSVVRFKKEIPTKP